MAQTVVFVLVLLGFSTITELPWSVWRTFVLEARHGFNKTTPGTFVADFFKTLLLSGVLVPPVVIALTYILQVRSLIVL